jgi:hypothetical protein
MTPAGQTRFVKMNGAVFETELNWTPRSNDRTINGRADGPFDGDGTVEVALGGSFDMFGYLVEAQGKVSALRCR